MTKGEAILVLDSLSTWLGHERPITEEIVEAIKTISRPSIPSNIDEAAEEYSLDVRAKPYENLVKEAFKHGAAWRDSQISKLPSSLDEAAEAIAEKYATKVFGKVDTHEHIDHNGRNECRALYSIGCIEGFKAGAEWQLNEDSKKHYFVQLKNIKEAWQELKKSNPGTESKPAVCFYKGAEWMAGQGITVRKKIEKIDDGTNQIPTYCNGFEITELDVPFLSSKECGYGNEVIVQIRKK